MIEAFDRWLLGVLSTPYAENGWAWALTAFAVLITVLSAFTPWLAARRDASRGTHRQRR